MSDKYNLEEELNQRELEQDKEKETAIFKHLADIGVMDKLVFALNEYIIKFGRLLEFKALFNINIKIIRSFFYFKNKPITKR